MKLHDTIQNFYIKILKPLFSIEVLGNNGKWNNIKSFNITDKQVLYKIKTTSCELLCSKNHILIDENLEEVLAINSLGKKIILSNNTIEEVILVEETDRIENTYDLSLDDSSDHTYYCNKLLSHNCVILDEFAFLPRNIADKLFTSMFPVISSSENGKIILVSTPNGSSGLYYDIWKLANSKDEKDSEGWKPFTMWWWQVPGHDEKWKQTQIAAIGKERFAQEFNNEFLAGSSFHKLIPDDIIEKYRMRLSENKIAKHVVSKNLQIISDKQDKVYEFTMWHEFQPSHAYIAAADVAEGVGGDSSALYIFDVTHFSNIRLCAKFANNKVSPIEFAYVCRKILKLYADPYYIVESNGVGSAFIDILKITYEYPNIVREGKDNAYGMRSHVQSKIRALLWLRDMFTTEGIDWEIYDEDLINEMSTFIKKNNTSAHAIYQAMVGAHDDLIMTLCWAAWLLNPDVIEKYLIVVETFTTVLEKILPKVVAPQEEYTQKEIETTFKDPLYRQFMDFKDEISNKYGQALENEKKEDAKFFNRKIEETRQMNNYKKPFFIVNGSGFSNEWENSDFSGPTW